jgi:Domain of unknown function (DUF4258)
MPSNAGGGPRPFDELEFIDHADERAARRGVSRADIEEVLRNPEQTGLPADPGREHVARRLRPGCEIHVIYEQHGRKVKVISVWAKHISFRKGRIR